MTYSNNTNDMKLNNKFMHGLVFALTFATSNGFIPEIGPTVPQRVTPINMNAIGSTLSTPPPSNMDYLSALPKETSTRSYTRTMEAPKPTETITSAPSPPEVDTSILVQGGSLRTWSYRSPLVEQVEVVLSTEGRPLDADLELWHGPDNTPCKIRAYVENGQVRPFSAVIATPRGPNTIAIRNIGQIEFPLAAKVSAKDIEMPSVDSVKASTTIQGGALRTYPFDALVNSVEVNLKTDGRPLNARIELLQGPNNNKQVVELYTEDGFTRPFFCVIETPGSGNVVRVVNTAPVEFPMTASVLPHTIDNEFSSYDNLDGDVVMGGDLAW